MNVRGIQRFLGLIGLPPRPLINTADTTVGAATLTGAAMAGGMITRSGSTAAYTDTTATAGAIVGALPIGDAAIGVSWILRIKNTVAFVETIGAGTGVTLSGITTVPPLSVGDFLITVTALNTVTMVGIGSGAIALMPAAQFTTDTAATLAAGAITGASVVSYINTGNNATVTVRTAAQMFADFPNAQVGMSWTILYRNTHATQNTITADGGATVTLTGTMTVAQNVTRTLVGTFNTATTATLQSMGISAAAA